MMQANHINSSPQTRQDSIRYNSK